jgi:hypothetical protein
MSTLCLRQITRFHRPMTAREKIINITEERDTGPKQHICLRCSVTIPLKDVFQRSDFLAEGDFCTGKKC